MSAQRLKTTFNNYFSQAQMKTTDLFAMKAQFGLGGAHAARVFCWAARPTASLGKIGHHLWVITRLPSDADLPRVQTPQ